MPEGPEGLPEGSEGLPEGSKGLPKESQGPTGGQLRGDKFMSFFRCVHASL